VYEAPPNTFIIRVWVGLSLADYTLLYVCRISLGFHTLHIQEVGAGLLILNPELKTQNSKLKTQNSKLKTQNSKLKTQNSKLKTQNSKLES
jgi:cell division protein FtsB